MYIEMTTFAIPTFLVKLAFVLIGAVVIWLVLAAIGITVYNRAVERAIRKQIEIDAEIDRLHK
jgi:hypothetical protein